MKIAVAGDERTHLTDTVTETLREMGHELKLFGPLAGDDMPWPVVSQKLGGKCCVGRDRIREFFFEFLLSDFDHIRLYFRNGFINMFNADSLPGVLSFP
ncbi:hypothetical protein QUF72_20220 [Desulfobacterales bacterium HSG2]|nr:hypothetical protein [Desulfobacterales bacterium HSG2]